MKKVIPLEIINNSVSNMQPNEISGSFEQLPCRLCHVTPQINLSEHELIYPCTCLLPIHKSCLYNEMKNQDKSQKKPTNDKKQQRYNCKKCSEVIRFNSNKQLKCRSCQEIREFSKKRCCLCATLSILTVIVILILILIIVLSKSNGLFQDKVLCEATIIGLSIGMGVLLLIVSYFFISQVLIKISYTVKLLERRQPMKGKHWRNNSISIINYQ